MAITVNNFDSLGPALSNIGNLFANSGSMAVEADLQRQRRNQIIAATAVSQRDAALKQQQQDIIAQQQAQAGGLRDLYTSPDLNLEDPATIARIIAGGITANPNGGGMDMLDPKDVLGSNMQIAPGMYDPGELSNVLAGTGTAWNSTPAGAAAENAAQYQQALDVAKVGQQGGLAEILLKSMIPAGAGGGAGQPLARMNVDGKDAEMLAANVEQFINSEFPGQQVGPEIKQALLAAAGEEAAMSHSIVGAVERAAQRMSFGEVKGDPYNGWFGSTFMANPNPSKVILDEAPATPAAAAPSGALGSAQVQQLAQTFGIDLGSLLGGAVASPGPEAAAPPQQVPAAPPSEGPTREAAARPKQVDVSVAAKVTRDADGKYWTRGPDGQLAEIREGRMLYGQKEGMPDWVFHNGKWEKVQ